MLFHTGAEIVVINSKMLAAKRRKTPILESSLACGARFVANRNNLPMSFVGEAHLCDFLRYRCPTDFRA